jgi:hypothetical protein
LSEPYGSPFQALLASFIHSPSWVTSPPDHEPFIFFDNKMYEFWHHAMEAEIQVLLCNGTWSLVPFHPLKNMVSSWVYKIKCRANGSIERYKAHFIAKGFTHQKSIDDSKIWLSKLLFSWFSLLLFLKIRELINLIFIMFFPMGHFMKNCTCSNL